MLCQFSFQNFKSYKGETTFDFQAAAIPEFAESLLICKVETKENKEIKGASLLPVGVVYGPNGGGKSNLLQALSCLISTVVKPIHWIYEFQMPDEEKKRLLDMAGSLGMTSDEFIQKSFRYAMDHSEETEKEAVLQQIQQANALGIRLVKMYPVYQGETEAQAYRRAVKEEMQRNEKYTVYRKTDISGQSRDVS